MKQTVTLRLVENALRFIVSFLFALLMVASIFLPHFMAAKAAGGLSVEIIFLFDTTPAREVQ